MPFYVYELNMVKPDGVRTDVGEKKQHDTHHEVGNISLWEGRHYCIIIIIIIVLRLSLLSSLL